MGMKVKVGQQRRVRLTLKAYAHAGLQSQKAQAFAFIGAPLLVLGFILAYSSLSAPPTAEGPRTYTILYFGTGLIAWLLLSWGLAWRFPTAGDRSRIKKLGLKAKVMANNHREIKSLLSEHCKQVGVKEPDAYLLDEEVGRVQMLGGGKPVLVISTNMQEVLSAEEFVCAVMRAIGELRTKVAGLKSWIRFTDEASPLLRFCLFPAVAVGFMLKQNWSLFADITTDRLLLVTTRRPRLCLSTIIKLEIEANPMAQISHADVEAFLKQRSGVEATTDGVSTHFRMGTGLQSVPGLNERVQELIRYASSTEYKELCAKIDEALSKVK